MPDFLLVFLEIVPILIAVLVGAATGNFIKQYGIGVACLLIFLVLMDLFDNGIHMAGG